MSRLTLRLPATLHQQLSLFAENEGVSLNQYIVYALTRQVTLAGSIQMISSNMQEVQKQSFSKLINELGVADMNQVDSILAEREIVEPEEELTPSIIARMQEKIRNSQYNS